MFKQLLKIILLPPELIKSHAKGYVDLANEVGWRFLHALKNKWWMYGLSALAMALALVFGGMALMLWSIVPMTGAAQAWVLWALPGSCLVASGLCAWRARSLPIPSLLQDIQSQWQLDLAMIRSADTP
jgi:hypothetical protein